MLIINTDKVLIHLVVLLHIVCFTTQFKFPVIKVDKNGRFIEQLPIDEHSTCVPVRNCSTYMWMLSNTRKFRRINTHTLKSVFKKKKCNIVDADSSSDVTLDTLVACPTEKDDHGPDCRDKEEQAQDDLDYVPDYDYMIDYESDSEFLDVRSIGGLFETRIDNYEYSDTCIGSLELSHGFMKSPLKTIKIFKISSKWKMIREIKKLKRRYVLRLRSDGNCCWRAYQLKRFRGRYEDIFPGYDEFPIIQPKSLKKINC